jgi:hypothetical protein
MCMFWVLRNRLKLGSYRDLARDDIEEANMCFLPEGVLG